MSQHCLDCDRLIRKGSRCTACAKRRTQFKAAHRRGGLSTTEYEALRQQVLQRDGGCTARPGIKRLGINPQPTAGDCGLLLYGALVVDHIVPLVNGGESVLDNLRTLCHAHHIRRRFWDRERSSATA